MAKITTDTTTERVGRSVNGSTKKYADEKSRTEINKIFTDLANIGLGYATCSTAATTAAKTVSISNFLLLTGGIVSVLFTTANTAADATLNVSSTGAKPIRVNGSALQPGVIKAQTVVQMQYDGTAWNIVGMMGLEQSQTPESLVVDMGLPSGVLWAKASIDISTPSGFQEVDGVVSPFKYECSFFSWGNTDGHNPNSTSAFDYNWGTDNDTEPYVSSLGAKLTGNIAPSQDAARANLGAPWRIPTKEEFAELFANIDYMQADGTTTIPTSTANKLVTVNGVTGIYLKSKNNGKLLFFPCSGYGNGQSWSYRGSNGNFWSLSLGSASYGRRLIFYSGGVDPQSNYNRFYGFAVRPVQ
jgi:hypothetical protein